MPNLNDYKLEVVAGINDAPIPPNYLNNGLGSNGAYVVQKINDLIDALQYTAPTLTLTSTVSAQTIEVGAALLNPGTQVTLSYSATNSQNLASARFYADGTQINNNNYNPGAPLVYSLSSYTVEPNIYLSPKTYTWQARGIDLDSTQIISNSIAVNWAYRTYVGWSTSNSVTDYTNLTSIINTLSRPNAVTKPDTGSEAYLYIFLPVGKTGAINNGYSAYATFKAGGFDVVMASITQVTITRLGVPVIYNIYRLQNPSFGSFTLNLT